MLEDKAVVKRESIKRSGYNKNSFSRVQYNVGKVFHRPGQAYRYSLVHIAEEKNWQPGAMLYFGQAPIKPAKQGVH
jgi:hypothetical protein